MQYIVGFNGPPRVGKDTIANMLRHILDQECDVPTHVDHLARPMRQMAMSLLGLNPNDFESYTALKDQPQALLKSALTGDEESIRRLMIRTSEEFIKPNYGQDFWGRKLVGDHKWIDLQYPGILLVPDIGFPAEVAVFDGLAKKIPPVQTLIVQVSRNGVGWGVDSRISCEGLQNLALENDETPYDAALKVYQHIRDNLGWTLSCAG